MLPFQPDDIQLPLHFCVDYDIIKSTKMWKGGSDGHDTADNHDAASGLSVPACL